MGKFTERAAQHNAQGTGGGDRGSSIREPLLNSSSKGTNNSVNGAAAGSSATVTSVKSFNQIDSNVRRDLEELKRVIQHLRKTSKELQSPNISPSQQNKLLNKINTQLESSEQLISNVNEQLQNEMHPLVFAKGISHDESSTRNKRMKDLVEGFHGLTDEYEKVKEKIRPQLQHIGPSQPGRPDQHSSVQDEQQEMDMVEIGDGELELHAAVIDERNRAFEQIEKTTNSIHQAFKDLNTLIHKQGEDLDDVDNNVDVAHVAAEKGVEQLESADRYQKKYGKKLICFVSIGVALCLTVALILYFKLK